MWAVLNVRKLTWKVAFLAKEVDLNKGKTRLTVRGRVRVVGLKVRPSPGKGLPSASMIQSRRLWHVERGLYADRAGGSRQSRWRPGRSMAKTRRRSKCGLWDKDLLHEPTEHDL